MKATKMADLGDVVNTMLMGQTDLYERVTEYQPLLRGDDSYKQGIEEIRIGVGRVGSNQVYIVIVFIMKLDNNNIIFSFSILKIIWNYAKY
jgi:hypothetical protein